MDVKCPEYENPWSGTRQPLQPDLGTNLGKGGTECTRLGSAVDQQERGILEGEVENPKLIDPEEGMVLWASSSYPSVGTLE